MIRPLTPQQHHELSERIRAAEARTAGEIYCVVARASDGYFYPAAFAVAAFMLAISLILAVLLDRSWIGLSHLVFVTAQAAAFGAALLVLRAVPPLRIRMVPRRLRYRRAHDNAVRQFLAHNVHTTEARTGVLIFVSMAERYVEIVADAGINARVAQPEWDDLVARLTGAAAVGRLPEGLADAIDRAGALLAEHFPAGASNPNELGDHVVEI